MENDRLQHLLLKLGDKPHLSLRRFLTGLALFLCAIGLIYGGRDHVYWLQAVGLLLMLVAILFAAVGYIGILANRLAFFRHQSFKNKTRFKDLK